jgi:hypothetical protein
MAQMCDRFLLSSVTRLEALHKEIATSGYQLPIKFGRRQPSLGIGRDTG